MKLIQLIWAGVLFKLHSASGRVGATFDTFPHKIVPTRYAASCDEIDADLIYVGLGLKRSHIPIVPNIHLRRQRVSQMVLCFGMLININI